MVNGKSKLQKETIAKMADELEYIVWDILWQFKCRNSHIDVPEAVKRIDKIREALEKLDIELKKPKNRGV